MKQAKVWCLVDVNVAVLKLLKVLRVTQRALDACISDDLAVQQKVRIVLLV